MSRSWNPTVRAEPNVTPMIDVMLVLLIIFMAITPLLVNGVQAVPPSAVHLRAHPEAPEDHTLGIDRDGRYYLDRLRVPEPLLAEQLKAIYVGAENRVLFVRADRELQYSRVLRALDIARLNGVQVAGMIAESPH